MVTVNFLHQKVKLIDNCASAHSSQMIQMIIRYLAMALQFIL